MVIMRLWLGNSLHLLFKDNYKIAKLLCLSGYEGLYVCNKLIPVHVLLDSAFFTQLSTTYRNSVGSYELLLRGNRQFPKTKRRCDFSGIKYINMLADFYGLFDQYLKKPYKKPARRVVGKAEIIKNANNEVAEILLHSSDRIFSLLKQKSWKEIVSDKAVFDILHLCDRYYLRRYQYNCRFGDKLLERIKENWKKSEKGRHNRYTLKETVNFFKVDIKITGKSFK
jgi:hypothetical protein